MLLLHVNSRVEEGMCSHPDPFQYFFRQGNGEATGKTVCGISLGEAMVIDLDFTEDLVIFAEALKVLVHALDTLGMESGPLDSRSLDQD